MKIAFIDDKTENLFAWQAAMEMVCGKHADLSIFDSIDAFEEALSEEYLPNIVFTDYNIDDRCGEEIVELIRDQFGNEIYIIAHSSKQWRNEYLLKIGADEILAKYKGISPSPTILDRFWSVDDLIELIK